MIEEINDKIELGSMSLEGVALVTLDVEQMYNNITDDMGLGACRKYLENRIQQNDVNDSNLDENLVPASSIMESLELCLKNAFFQFNKKVYHQKSGVGTGIKLAPPYACLAMGEFEKIAFESHHQFLDLMLFWKRFIDDVLGLFKGNEAEFEEFVEWLNSIMKGVVKFKSNFSTEKVEFLDLIISKEEGKLKTNLFIKPSNLQLFLDFKSNHPKHCKIGIVYGQALRIIERCSDLSDANLHLEKLKGKLLERNYPVEVVDTQFDRAKKQTRRQK